MARNLRHTRIRPALCRRALILEHPRKLAGIYTFAARLSMARARRKCRRPARISRLGRGEPRTARRQARSPPPAMSLVDILLLAAAGFLSGALNAVAGGGTFFTFAALLAAGLPPITANATSAVALTVGSVGERRRLSARDRARSGAARSGWRSPAAPARFVGALILIALDNVTFARHDPLAAALRHRRSSRSGRASRALSARPKPATARRCRAASPAWRSSSSPPSMAASSAPAWAS